MSRHTANCKLTVVETETARATATQEIAKDDPSPGLAEGILAKHEVNDPPSRTSRKKSP